MAKSKKIKELETRHSEETMFATDVKDMINKYIVEPVYRTWDETFIDEGTGEAIEISRKEFLFERGLFIDANLGSSIQFSLEANGIKGVNVSTQKRAAYELESVHLGIWVAKVDISAKPIKFLLYSSNIINAIDIVKDYVEQKYEGAFKIIECKEFVRSIILEDSLKEIEEQDDVTKKFIQIDTTVKFDDCETSITFIVNTTSIEKAMMIINLHISERENEVKRKNEENGVSYTPRDFKVEIEKAAPIPIKVFIPKLFTEAYCTIDN